MSEKSLNEALSNTQINGDNKLQQQPPAQDSLVDLYGNDQQPQQQQQQQQTSSGDNTPNMPAVKSLKSEANGSNHGSVSSLRASFGSVNQAAATPTNGTNGSNPNLNGRPSIVDKKPSAEALKQVQDRKQSNGGVPKNPALNQLNRQGSGSMSRLGSFSTDPVLSELKDQAGPLSPQPAKEPTMKYGGRIMDRQWEDVQKRTFTKWINSQFAKKRISPIKEMAEEFSDGAKLIQLLEIIGEETIDKYYKAPKFRVQKCENQLKALDFIKKNGVSLTNIGPEDLVDKNEKLYLGMIWTIILRWTIAEITEEGLSAKEGLLLWCQRKTAGYKGVHVKEFTFSWQDGLAMCALIHRHRPDLLQFDQLSKANARDNVALAFDVAEKHLGIPKLLEVEDLVDVTKPDERSVMTYIAQYFHAFAALDKVEVAGRRAAKFADVVKAAWDMRNNYEQRARAFLNAVADIQAEWENSGFDGSFADAKKQSVDFIIYKESLKRQWVAEKRDMDTLLSNIQTKLRTYNLTPYVPPAALGLDVVDSAWAGLVESEGGRRKTINAQILSIKQKLKSNYAQLANKFMSELDSISVSLGQVEGELQDQLDAVHGITDNLTQLAAGVDAIKAADNDCNEAGIEDSDRDETVYSVSDLEFDFGLVKSACQKKAAFIENQMVARQMTNVTPQQLEEFETAFHAFDHDNSNALSIHEFKACLQSLGKAYEENEFNELFKKVSEGTERIEFQNFTKFMVSITEDRVTIDQLRQSFKAISQGKAFITEQQMAAGQLPPENIEYLKSVMPLHNDQEGHYDFESYLKNVFNA